MMLQERTKFASSLSDIYLFSAEFIRIMSKDDMFQVSKFSSACCV